MRFAALLALPILILVGCESLSSRAAHGIPNLAQVDPGVWRGGQPTEAGWKYLSTLGVRNVVKLNEEKEASDNAAWTNGMAVYYVPVTLWQQLGIEPLPSNLRLGYESNIGGTFIHCEHGQDRTGLFVALLRLRHGWTKADAEKEMLEHGFHKELHGLWEYWEHQGEDGTP